jgi:hypothetical protein
MEICVPEVSRAKINDFSLKDYLKNPLSTNKKIKEIDSLLKKKGGPDGKKAYSFEKEAIEKLRLERIQNTYPSIDLSFLSKNIEYPINEEKILKYSLPKFAVYNFFGKEKSEFAFDDTQLPSYGGEYKREIFIKNSLPKIIQNELIKCYEYSKITSPIESYTPGTKNLSGIALAWLFSSKKLEGYRNFSLRLSTEFHASIEDDQTIANINNALNFFKKEEFYLVTERKPEDWKVTKIESGDPLILGLYQQVIPFLIDIFNTTPLEKYVSNIYIKNKN